jgi:hypothetical protein
MLIFHTLTALPQVQPFQFIAKLNFHNVVNIDTAVDSLQFCTGTI